MKHLRPIFRQRLAYAIYALTLVCTLSLCNPRGANTLFLAQQGSCAIAQEHPEP